MTGASASLKGGKKFLIAPSLLDADLMRLGEEIKRVEGLFDWIHVDVMDGHCVPNLSFGPSLVSSLRRGFADSFIDVHIMVEPAERFVDMFTAVSPDILTVQVEATKHIHRVLQSIRAAGVRPGIAINPGTPVSAIETVLHMADLVLVMTVNPGFGGQSFLPATYAKVADLKRRIGGRPCLIQVDGGVDMGNARRLTDAGADVLVSGSAFFSHPPYAARLAGFRASVEQGA